MADNKKAAALHSEFIISACAWTGVAVCVITAGYIRKDILL